MWLKRIGSSTFFLSCWPAATAKSVVGAATNWLIGSRHSWLVGNLTRYLKVGRAHTMTLGTSTTSIVSPERFSGPDRRPHRLMISRIQAPHQSTALQPRLPQPMRLTHSLKIGRAHTVTLGTSTTSIVSPEWSSGPDRRPQRLMISRIQACHQSTALQPRLPQPMCLKQLWAGTMVSHGAGDAGKGPWETFRAVAAIAGWSGPATCGLGMGTPLYHRNRQTKTIISAFNA